LTLNLILNIRIAKANITFGGGGEMGGNFQNRSRGLLCVTKARWRRLCANDFLNLQADVAVAKIQQPSI
jgi:hypothetical protein